ncbi:MAG: ATP-binding protein [Coprobacillaceae bacterium]
MKSVYGKLISGFLITIIFSFSVAGYISLRSNYEQVEEGAKEELIATNHYLAGLINSVDATQLESIIMSYVNSSEITVTIYSNNYASSIYRIYGNKKIAPSQERLYELYRNDEPFIEVKSDIQSYGELNYIDGDSYYMYIQKDISHEKSVYTNSAVLIFGCVFLSGCVVFLAIADIIVKPITKLTNATKELSKGNYGVRVNYTGDDEISRLNQGFNQMAQQLAKHEETRQKFISDISHEFQTPLTAIQGFANILKEEDLPKAQREKYADIILFHSKRLSTLSKNMLQLTLLENEEVRLEVTNYSVVDQLARVISTQENQAILKDIEIEFVRPKKDILIDGDEHRLEQVWINVINNAIKYTDPGGIITVHVKKYSKEVEVMVEDTGNGMSKDVISHIFDRFYREDKSRSVEGNGLGLAIVKTIIDLHGGKIDVISQVDVGSTFIIKLPVERSFNLKDRLLNK